MREPPKELSVVTRSTSCLGEEVMLAELNFEILVVRGSLRIDEWLSIDFEDGLVCAMIHRAE